MKASSLLLGASLAAAAALAACARRVINASGGTVEHRSRSAVLNASDRTVRVGLASASTPAPRLSGSGGWRLYGGDGETLVARAPGGQEWRIERQGTRMRALRPDGVATVWQEGSLVARPEEGETGLVSFNGKRYRGELLFLPIDTGIAVVNRVRMDDYLRGVVPLEIGTRSVADSAAVQAQAVTARSYAYVHLGPVSPSRPYDLTAGVGDQIYGGADVETPVSNNAVDATRGLVLRYAGRVVNAPYHSTCGGSTAEAGEIWRTQSEPYLQRVSDQIPGSTRFYCDIAPRFRWTRTLEGPALQAALVQYLGRYTDVPGPNPGVARDVMVDTRTPSGRVGTLKIATDRGNYVLRGNDIRYVLRTPGGEILNSTYFSVETAVGRDGAISRLILRGSGYGHGVGMCQWGAIGRAREGQDFGTILRTYYPGATIGAVE
jgi:stage II sporulation protein D